MTGFISDYLLGDYLSLVVRIRRSSGLFVAEAMRMPRQMNWTKRAGHEWQPFHVILQLMSCM
ncbi:MAG: hypothetical protein DMG94_00695 [Acidobacteria bacterium]|nr:MAG: hypothetical protein DMG94_00695 [Acidobacteriota bacterium]